MSQKYPMHCYVQNFGGYGDVISVEGRNAGIHRDNTYLIIVNGIAYTVHSTERLFSLTFGIDASEKVAKLIGVEIVASKYLIIDLNKKGFLFIFDQFCIYEPVYNRVTYEVKKFNIDRSAINGITRLNYEGQNEIIDVLDSNILSDEGREAVLFLYKKLCRFAGDFTDVYSQLNSLWPKTNIKSAQ